MQRISFAFATALLIAVPSFGQAPRKRIAILDFDYATVQSSVSAVFGTNQDVGKGIADLLVDRLVTDGHYSVIERKAIAKIMAEQNFSNSDRVDPTSAAKLGKLLGVDAIVIGSITQFGRDDQNRSASGTGFGGIANRYGLGGVGQHKAKAVVGISARLVSVETGEILAVASGKGESQRSGANLLGGGGSWNGGGGAVDMGSSNFGQTIIGEAVGQAVTRVASGLENSASKLPTSVMAVSALVADVSGISIVINEGTKAGIHSGDHLLVKRPVRQIKDPATGKILRSIEDKVGEITITEADDISATGTFSGPGSPKLGDIVKNQ
jgi:curli biogenesis system outer membrane secretion channel CsgG